MSPKINRPLIPLERHTWRCRLAGWHRGSAPFENDEWWVCNRCGVCRDYVVTAGDVVMIIVTVLVVVVAIAPWGIWFYLRQYFTAPRWNIHGDPMSTADRILVPLGWLALIVLVAFIWGSIIYLSLVHY